MKKNILIILVFFATTGIAQPVRLHLMGGFANYSGDIQQRAFTLNQANRVISAGGTFNITQQIALRGDYSFAKLGADDKLNKPSLKTRNLNFKTIVQELNLMGEFDFLNSANSRLIPY